MAILVLIRLTAQQPLRVLSQSLQEMLLPFLPLLNGVMIVAVACLGRALPQSYLA